MTAIANFILLIITLFAFNQVYFLIYKKVSKLPIVTSRWSDWWGRKPQISIIQRGYNTYSRAAKSFIFKDLNLIPPALFPEVRRLPSTVLSSSAANEDLLGLARSLGNKYWDSVPWVRQNVIRSIAGQMPPIRDEISRQFLKQFSPRGGESWRSVPIWATSFKVMNAISARFLLGQPFSDNEAFTEMIGQFAKGVGIEVFLLSQFPRILRPLIAQFLGAKSRVYRIKEMLRPYVMDCLMETEDGKIVMQVHESCPDEPLLYQFVAYVLPKYSDPTKTPAQMRAIILDEVVGRYLAIFFATIDTTTITFAQACIDLVSHSRALYADIILDEINNVLQRHNGQWNITAIGELKHLDSFIHESQRLHPVGITLTGRKVMSPGGWTFSNGDHFPQGAVLRFPTWFVHTDEEVYENALEFNGFRFINDKRPESVPSDIFMSFGHGHHACPGRRFALMIVRFMVIEFLTKYEYVELPERPEDFILGTSMIPDIKREIKIRPLTEG